MFLLDTDHVSLLQRGQPHVIAHVLATPARDLATTIITVEEQCRGRLDRIRQARSDAEVVNAYQRLRATVLAFQTITVVDFDAPAQTVFHRLRAQYRRLGTLDLRIAAIALSREAILVTRNHHDFSRIPAIQLRDWSQPDDASLSP